MLTQPRVLVDIGDSAGTHIRYLRRPTNAEFRAISVNVDPIAVNRIRSQGMEAYCCSAEDIARVGAEADFFLLFETLEHLLSPAEFLHELSRLPSCRCLVLSVPWVRHSRLGLQHLRHPGALATPETTHMFELAPSDLRLLFRHCGWRLLHSELYYQYPRWHPLMVMRGFWRDHDFEGFYGAVLQPDSSGSELYTGWEKRPAQHSG